MTMTARHWILLITLSVLWGGAFFFAAIAVEQLPPLTVVLSRVSIAALVLWIYLRFRKATLPGDLRTIGCFLVMGLLNNLIPFSLLFWAQTTISSGLASILNATTPIFSILISHLVLSDEKAAMHKMLGVLLGLIGVAILIGNSALSGETTATLGIIACLGAALSYGVASVYGRRFRSMGVTPDTGAFGQLAATSVMILPIALIVDHPWTLPPPSSGVIISVLCLATFSTALAYLIFFRLLASTGAVNTALVTLLIPVSAIILGATFLGEQLAFRHYVGMALILSGLIAVDGRMIGRGVNRQ